MTKRKKQGLLAVGALAALALGGADLAQAQTSTAQTALEPTSGPDRDSIQSARPVGAARPVLRVFPQDRIA